MQNALFVSNNGNMEGSVTAFTIDENGMLQFVNRVVTGIRPTSSAPCAGCNAYEISLSPNGEYLATAHAAGVEDSITIFKVNPNGSITQVLQVPFGFPNPPGTPLDLVWVTNEIMAFIRTDVNPDQIVIARFDAQAVTFTELTWNVMDPPSNSVGYLAAHPTLPIVYANDSALKVVRAYNVNQLHFSLELIDSEPVGAPFPLELAIDPDGTHMYASGGISNGGHSIIGLNIAPDGTLSPMPGSPFVSPGQSPSNVFVSGDDSILVAGHGSDATVRTFLIDSSTGALTATPFMFDVGLQGTCGDVRMMDDLLFVTDNSSATDGLMGVYSFKVEPNGSLTQNGPIVLSQGIAPRSLAIWRVPTICVADLGGDGQVGVPDLLAVINGWGPCVENCPPSCLGDLDGSCSVGVPDLLAIINAWGPCP